MNLLGDRDVYSVIWKAVAASFWGPQALTERQIPGLDGEKVESTTYDFIAGVCGREGVTCRTQLVRLTDPGDHTFLSCLHGV